MYRFFWELAFHNHQEFFEENRARYQKEVKIPLYQLAALLLPTALEMDPKFETRLATTVSRIRRDTRYSKDKSPYRDHAWIAFRYPSHAVSMSFSPYIEFNRESYGYGMGMYAPDTERMQKIRNRILAQPLQFLDLVENPAFCSRFTMEGESYKKPRFFHENETIQQYLNLRRLSFSFSSSDIKKTTQPEILDECLDALKLLTPVYRFLFI